MKLNIDKLHDVVMNKVSGRQVGKTLSQCHMVAGHIEVGVCSNLICILPTWNWLGFLIPMLQEVLLDSGLEYKRLTKSIIETSNNKTIYFLNKSDVDGNKLKGFNDYLLFYFD